MAHGREVAVSEYRNLRIDMPRTAGTDSITERCSELFSSGMYCAESVLQAVAEAHGQLDPLIPKIATGFCGGISRTSGMCGALAGGIMALGLLTGRSSPQESKDQCYALSHRLVCLFRKKFGSTQCTDLLGCDISTAYRTQRFRARDLATKICAPVTRQAAGLVEEIFALRDTIRHPLL
ncbi:MAG: C-GCAxxG-C-C family protein [Hyphomicrobiales bacterium]